MRWTARLVHTDEIMTPQYLQAIAALLSAVAWPLVILVFLLTQRRQLVGLLDKLEEVTFPVASAPSYDER